MEDSMDSSLKGNGHLGYFKKTRAQNKIKTWIRQILQLPKLAVYSPARIMKVDCRRGERCKSKRAFERPSKRDKSTELK